MVGRCPVLQHSFPKAGWLLGPTSFWRAACHSSPALSSLQSDSSYDFLSAEEKECLLFLEETIGSLDTEADSGLSTEKSEQATTPRGPRALPTTQPAPQGKTDCLKKKQKKTTSSWPLSLLSALCSKSHGQKKEQALSCLLVARIKPCPWREGGIVQDSFLCLCMKYQKSGREGDLTTSHALMETF